MSEAGKYLFRAELLMCSGCMRCILLLSIVTSCLETIDCMWRMIVFMSVVVPVGVCGNYCCVTVVVEDSVLLFVLAKEC